MYLLLQIVFFIIFARTYCVYLFVCLLVYSCAEGGDLFTSFCLSVRQITEKVVNRFLTKFLGGVGHGPGANEFNFGDDLDHRPKSEIRIHWTIDYACIQRRSALPEHF